MPDMYGSERNDSELIDRFMDRGECDSLPSSAACSGRCMGPLGDCMGPEYCILILQ